MVYCPDDEISVFLEYGKINFEAAERHPTVHKLMPQGTGELLWVCTNIGLYAFELKERKVVQRYHKKGEGEHALPGNFIYDMHIDGHGDK